MATAADDDPVQNSSGVVAEVEEEETVTDEADEFTCCAHCAQLAQRQNEQRKAGQFCDLTLVFISGERVHSLSAHRSVLSAASHYFSQRLGEEDAPSGTLELRGWSSVGPDTMEAVVEFMYTGQICVTRANVHEVLELAHRFLLAHLKTFCGEFLMKRLTQTNCVLVHRLALTYSLDQLADGATTLIRRNFHKVIHSKEFCSLPFQLIRDWLSDSEIAVSSERELFEVIVRWVNCSLDEREKHFEEMFGLLRLTQLTPAYLTRVVRKESLVSNNAACRKLVTDALEVHAISLENLKLCDVGLYASYVMKFKPRFGQNMDIIMVVGGVSENGEHLSDCIGYFVAEDRWVNLPHIHNHHDGHAIAVTDNYVYVAGSMEPGFAKAVERYDPCNNTWESVSSLSTRKHSFGLACVQNALYSIGGHGNFSPGFKDVDVYKTDKDVWYSLDPAPQILRDVKTVVIEGRFVYIMARTPIDIEEDDGLRTVTICFDTQTNRWQEVASLPLIDSYCTFQMAVACSNFYNSASFCPKSYDVTNEEALQKISTSISEDILDSLPPEVITLEGASVCFLGEDIFVIGGWKANNSMDKQCRKEAYRYCAERKRWMLLPPMPQSRCRATACHVCVPYRYLHGDQTYPMPHNLTRQRDRFEHLQFLHRRTLTLRRQLQSQIEC
uniref:Kelch like family member 11 n=1 Tax=Neogobius melanostomus TaxID=47308 RepID=A0A8C6SK55_9GOBI